MSQLQSHLQRLLCKVDVLDGQQARAEGWHSAMPHDGGAGGRQHICQEGNRTGCQQHDIRVVLRIQQVHLKQQHDPYTEITRNVPSTFTRGLALCLSLSSPSSICIKGKEFRLQEWPNWH